MIERYSPSWRGSAAEKSHDVHEHVLAVVVNDRSQGRPLTGNVDEMAKNR